VVRLSRSPRVGPGTEEEAWKAGPLWMILSKMVDEIPGAAPVGASPGHEAVSGWTCGEENPSEGGHNSVRCRCHCVI